MPNKWLPTRRSFSAEPGRPFLAFPDYGCFLLNAVMLIRAHYGPSGYDAPSGSALSRARCALISGFFSKSAKEKRRRRFPGLRTFLCLTWFLVL